MKPALDFSGTVDAAAARFVLVKTGPGAAHTLAFFARRKPAQQAAARMKTVHPHARYEVREA